MPTDEELVVRREQAAVEYLEWSFQQWRTRALQNHRTLLRKCRRQLSLTRPAWQRQFDGSLGQGARRGHRAHGGRRDQKGTAAGSAKREFEAAHAIGLHLP